MVKYTNFTIVTFKAQQNLLKRGKEHWLFHSLYVTKWRVERAEALKPRGGGRGMEWLGGEGFDPGCYTGWDCHFLHL